MAEVAMSDPTAELTLLRAAPVALEARAMAAAIELSATKVEMIRHKAVVFTSDAVIAARHAGHRRSQARTIWPPRRAHGPSAGSDVDLCPR